MSIVDYSLQLKVCKYLHTEALVVVLAFVGFKCTAMLGMLFLFQESGNTTD